MNLYHYSEERHQSLLTLNAQHKYKSGLSEEYNNHISFFFERPPIEKIGNIFNNAHPIWFTGNKLFEYIVKVDSLNNFKYKVVEYPEKTKIYYDDNISLDTYHKLLNEYEKKFKYSGDNITDLKFALNHLRNTTKKYFDLLPDRNNFEEIKNKYAATVPHLMIYPDSGEIKPSLIKKIVIGTSVSLESKPIYLNW